MFVDHTIHSHRLFNHRDALIDRKIIRSGGYADQASAGETYHALEHVDVPDVKEVKAAEGDGEIVFGFYHETIIQPREARVRTLVTLLKLSGL